MSSFGFALLLILVWAYAIGATIAALRFARRPIVAPLGVAPLGVASMSGPPISVLKPLHGAEPGLFENLRSFADQDYPDFQLLLGVRDRTDSALPLARALIRERPLSDIELIVDPRAAGSNLKVANLENMMPAARHEQHHPREAQRQSHAQQDPDRHPVSRYGRQKRAQHLEQRRGGRHQSQQKKRRGQMRRRAFPQSDVPKCLCESQHRPIQS